jgi:hypothetical protein
MLMPISKMPKPRFHSSVVPVLKTLAILQSDESRWCKSIHNGLLWALSVCCRVFALVFKSLLRVKEYVDHDDSEDGVGCPALYTASPLRQLVLSMGNPRPPPY